MKKYYILMLMLMVSVFASAQKMTIKTGSGQTVEISCEGGFSPKEIAVASDGSVIFKMDTIANDSVVVSDNAVEPDSVDTFTPVDSLAEAKQDSLTTDSLVMDDVTDSISSGQTTVGLIANALAEELSPEYAEFNREHENYHPASERELMKDVAKQFLNEEDVETLDAIATLFSGIRFTKDSTFVPTYEQRKPKPLIRAYDTFELSGSFGKDISEISDAVASQVKEEDYGNDAENDQKIGGGIKYSRVYTSGKEVDGKWQQNPLGFAWSWGGLFSYSYQKDVGSYVNAMGKVGVQIGTDICVGVDALVGYGVTPYNTFLTNDMNHHVVNKSVWCFKAGVELWGSLNFSKDTYTVIYGRYINSVRPNNGNYKLSKDWEVVLEDFDPSSWTVGLAVGYKFGHFDQLSTDKRLQANISTGYQFSGNKGFAVAAEVDKLTQVSKSTTLSYGLMLENIFEAKDKGGSMTSIMLSGGFQVRQPHNAWFWGAKLLAGFGEYPVVNKGSTDYYVYEDHCAKPCLRGALQLTTGFKIGKCSQIFCSVRTGAHFGKSMDYEGFDESSTDNLLGFDLGASLGYGFTF